MCPHTKVCFFQNSSGSRLLKLSVRTHQATQKKIDYIMYIYEHKEWPNFFWDIENLNDLLHQIHFQQGHLFGRMETLGFLINQLQMVETLTEDVIKSSEIEGEHLEPSSVRSSIAKRLGIEAGGLEKVDRNVEGIVEIILDATQNFQEPLTRERLFAWHSSLFPDGRSGFTKIRAGKWRTGIVKVVSGHYGRETIHFEAPSAERVDREMTLFLNWINGEITIDPVLKAAIAHLWFLTIHPFDDGNGRIGRAIADLLLARSEKSSNRFYSLSSQIQQERKGYYTILEKTQKGGLDITPWIEWFFNCLVRAIERSLSNLNISDNKSHFWNSLHEIHLNDRQRKVINRILEGFEGSITSTKWAKMTKCSQDTAQRDIQDLIEKGIFIKNPKGGRSTSYSLVHMNIRGKIQ